MRTRYEDWKPGADATLVVAQANQICAEYRAQGYDLTLRQLYYQFVARALIPNTQRSYKRLGDIVNKARMAGLLDWSYIEDRTRNLESITHWNDPAHIVGGAARSFATDLWANQPTRVEVWVEKEALAGVIERSAARYDCAWFSCRGYVSQSEMHGAAQRIGRYIEAGQNVVVLHLGDHDPSGLDMTRDIAARLDTFTTQDYLNAHAGEFAGGEVEGGVTVKTSEIRRKMAERTHAAPGDALEVRRIALTWDQVEQYAPPPNPAKQTDARFEKYASEYGDESWELDALDPQVLDDLITAEVDELVDQDAYDQAVADMETHRELLTLTSDRWPDVVQFLRDAS